MSRRLSLLLVALALARPGSAHAQQKKEPQLPAECGQPGIVARMDCLQNLRWVVPATTKACSATGWDELKPDGDETGLPYDWGGADGADRFLENLKRSIRPGSRAQDRRKPLPNPHCSTGADCSGFVAICWNLPGSSRPTTHKLSESAGSCIAVLDQRAKHDTTPTPASFSLERDLRPGDVINYPGHHAMMFHHYSGKKDKPYHICDSNNRSRKVLCRDVRPKDLDTTRTIDNGDRTFTTFFRQVLRVDEQCVQNLRAGPQRAATLALNIEPSILDVGAIALGTPARTASVVIRHPAGSRVSVAPTTISGRIVSTTSPLSSTAAGEARTTVTASIRTDRPGKFEEVVRAEVTDAKGNRGARTFVVTGSIETPCLEIPSKPGVDLGTVATGAQATISTVLRNCGNVALDDVVLSTDSSGDVFDINPRSIVKLVPAEAMPFTLSAKASTSGDSTTGLYATAFNHRVELGRVRMRTVPPCWRVTVPSGGQFAKSGLAEISLDARIENCGDSILADIKVDVDLKGRAAGFATSVSRIPILPARSSQPLSVLFRPSDGDFERRSGQLSVTANDESKVVNLAAQRSRRCVNVLPPDGIAFGTVDTKDPVEKVLVLHNCGPATRISVRLSNSSDQEFTLLTAPIALAADTDEKVRIAFRPSSAGFRSARVVVDYGDGQPTETLLTATATRGSKRRR